MNNIVKGIIILAVILYIISPLDAMPGPVDDIIVALMGIGATKGASSIDS